MKKFLCITALLIALVFPISVKAQAYRFNYSCDAKQPLGDGTFYMTCHLLLNSDININHVKGSLILKNVKLDSVKTSSDWVNLNGLSSNVEFTSTKTHNGSFSVADFLFTGNMSDTECEASFMADIAEEKKTETPIVTKACAIIDGVYYGKNNNVVSEEKYYEECENYVCTSVNNKYYFNSKGQAVSYEEMLRDCSTYETRNPQTGVNSGLIILPLGIASILLIIRYAKKNQKIYKI